MGRLLQDWVAEHARTRPDNVAVAADADRLTYAELDMWSARLARVLIEAGCQPGDRVAMLMPKSPLAIAALLGIYKAGAVYVPLDPAGPATRLAKILDSCEPGWLLAGGTVSPLLAELLRDERWRTGLSIGWLDRVPPTGGIGTAFTLDDIASAPSDFVAGRTAPHDPAHILFTSGSTGTPKGVVITHANVVSFVEWATRYFAMDASDRVSGHAPLHFDLSFFDIFGALAVGGELHLVHPRLNVLPNRLADFIRTSQLTQWFSVPSVLTYMASFDVVLPDDFPALKRLLWCGDVLPTPTLMYWMERVPHATFTNLYGPTEATIASSYYTVPTRPSDPRASIPIGTACEGEELLVLGASGTPVRQGETGDLYIAGVGLAAGYWRDPERTAAAFVAHPERPGERAYRTGDLARVGEDGLVYFLGRSDSQIKSRGYRIELGEIEAALNTLRGVQECAVVAIDTGSFEGAVIGCAYVPASGCDAAPTTLKRDLASLVPPYMLPVQWLVLDRLPRNANGKTDRRRLKDALEQSVAHASQTP